MPTINKQTLHYRLLDDSDALLMYDLDSNPNVMHYITGGRTSTMDDITQLMLPRLNAYRNADKGWGLWGVFTKLEKQRDSFLGWILIRPMHFFGPKPNFNSLEIGWRFKESCWGKGIATQAAKHTLNNLCCMQDITTISAIAEPDNLGSINIMAKLGMEFDSYQQEQGPFDGKPVKVVLYSKSI
ncbi:GNAT family N-acetyltransferase [Shewanella sp. Scap07]|uniref:GNAT family N-acetyltransferase n=1 Tax=Shewanella sp. Scap07 TaxID=2589987 RepID=UPI0015BA65CB|nr:GNAT family N-acetyltransferase [Shewanella sp. Scap07]QLE85556.1 GNAT family N-acetyltransferase [Shewanella sp. Scap07]